jgi:diguanylate cyclase (GGDEF)-like protein/PAS domain S-box-containing protein
MHNYRLSELLDMSLIQKLADSNFRVSGLPLSIIDAYDASVLVSAGWTDICKNFHRAYPASHKRCMESDSSINGSLVEGESIRYKCKNGLWHVAIPIVVADKHVGTMFLTQFYFKDEIPERDYFSRQAREFGYDQKTYLAALDTLPVFSVEKVDYILAYDKALVRFIADLAEQALRIIETEKSLSKSEEKYRTLVNNIHIGVFRNTPGQGRFIHANPAMAAIFGYDSREEFIARPVIDIYRNPQDRERFLDAVKREGFAKDTELPMRKKDGTLIWCSCTATAHFNEQGEIEWLDGVIEDISERKKAEENLQKYQIELELRVRERTAALVEANERLRDLSDRDPLTMIYNRRKFFEFLDKEIVKAKRYARPLSLILIDLDHFKTVNDNHGHTVGDAVLKTITDVLGSTIREVDIFGRYGGEEFVVLAPETGAAGASALADKMRRAVENHSYPLVGKVTISAGVAEFSDTDSVASFIDKADRALYDAKNKGKNRVETDVCTSQT